ncbi:hypothetical protein BY996DRAFT_1204395 [Phakopsora pachyrhizi]|nr:hypothetical protein BY996DRAFT_1204395 [Phakopsora pachyrhizi]
MEIKKCVLCSQSARGTGRRLVLRLLLALTGCLPACFSPGHPALRSALNHFGRGGKRFVTKKKFLVLLTALHPICSHKMFASVRFPWSSFF